MSRRPIVFRQADVTRALRAARVAGLEVTGYEIDPVTGKITITTATGAAAPAVDEFTKWKSSHAD
jgi:hypothetical protein